MLRELRNRLRDEHGAGARDSIHPVMMRLVRRQWGFDGGGSSGVLAGGAVATAREAITTTAMKKIMGTLATAIAMMAPIDRPDFDGDGVGVLVPISLEEPSPEVAVPSGLWLLMDLRSGDRR